MLDSKLLLILRKLNTRERTRFKEYVASPFFNKHKGLIKLCDYLFEYAPLFNHENLSQKAAFTAIFPDEKYSEQLIYTLLSNLLELMNGFLAQIEFENNELAQKRLAMKALRNRKESKQWLSVKKQYDLINSKQNKIDSSALLESKLYFTELDEHFISKQLREEDPNLQSSSDKLDEFYFAEKLRLACDIISRNIVIKADYKSFELDSILRLIDANSEKFVKIPSVAVYRSILKMLTDEKSSYTETVFIIKSNQKFFKVEELKTQFDYAINFVIRKLNSGEPEWHRAFLDLHHYLLEHEILMTDGILQEWDFKNIVTVALRANETEWVDQFINDYKNKLPENVRENAYLYNVAALHFASGRYREAMQLLQEIEFTDESYQLGAKIILLKSYFELNELDAGLSLIIAYRRLVERSKTMSEYRINSNLNMLKAAQKIFNFQKNCDYYSSAKLKKTLKSINLSIEKMQPMANFDWISEKIDSIKIDLYL